MILLHLEIVRRHKQRFSCNNMSRLPRSLQQRSCTTPTMLPCEPHETLWAADEAIVQNVSAHRLVQEACNGFFALVAFSEPRTSTLAPKCEVNLKPAASAVSGQPYSSQSFVKPVRRPYLNSKQLEGRKQESIRKFDAAVS